MSGCGVEVVSRVERCCLYRRVGGERKRAGRSRAPPSSKMVLERVRSCVNGSEQQKGVATMVLRLRADSEGPRACKVDEAGPSHRLGDDHPSFSLSHSNPRSGTASTSP
jgi:hypothetical protein